jgi:hypothetical protein
MPDPSGKYGGRRLAVEIADGITGFSASGQAATLPPSGVMNAPHVVVARKPLDHSMRLKR